jgi:hypothetical protein
MEPIGLARSLVVEISQFPRLRDFQRPSNAAVRGVMNDPVL